MTDHEPSPEIQRWQQVRTLLVEAFDLPVADRASFLDRACGEDHVLRAELDSLLKADAAAEQKEATLLPEGLARAHVSIAENLAGDVLTAEGTQILPNERLGEQLGPYRLKKTLGRGGMGTVYLAERTDGEVRQQVAIKILRRGMDTDDILRRFRSERQILAELDHPNIARFLDGGRTEDGLPYLVLEYIDGEPIHTFCDRCQLDERSLIKLFLEVCDAVQSAHQNLVIHCDLKPSNILISRDGQAKLLDFGIAKVIHPDWQMTQVKTVPGKRPMTPGYAGPEQLLGERVSTATDVYSLGVVLVECLTGRRPQTDMKRPALQGDLENIAAKALEDEPRRRYGTVDQFADDLRRFLDGRPVLARAPTFTYRVRRFIGRHRISMALATIALLAVSAGVVGTIWQAHIAAVQRDLAVQEAERGERVLNFLTAVLTTATPGTTPQDQITVKEMLVAGAQRLETELGDDPQVAARIAEVLAEVHRTRSEIDQADALAIKAVELYRSQPGHEADVARSLNHLAYLRMSTGNFVEARNMMEESLLTLRRIHGDQHFDVAQNLSQLSYVLGDLGGQNGRVVDLRRESFDIRRELFAEDDLRVIQGRNDLAHVLYAIGQCTEAEGMFRENRRLQEGLRDMDLARTLLNLSKVLFDQGQQDEALDLLHRAIALTRRLLPPGHFRLGRFLLVLGHMQLAQEDLDAAWATYEEASTIFEASLGPRNRSMVLPTIGLGRILLERGQTSAAVERLRQGVELAEQTLVEQSPITRWARSGLNRGLVILGEIEMEEALLREMTTTYNSLPLSQGSRYDVARDLADLFRKSGKTAEAEVWQVRAGQPACPPE